MSNGIEAQLYQQTAEMKHDLSEKHLINQSLTGYTSSFIKTTKNLRLKSKVDNIRGKIESTLGIKHER